MSKYKILKVSSTIKSPYKVGDVVNGTPSSNGSIINVVSSSSPGVTYGFSTKDVSIVDEKNLMLNSISDNKIIIISSSIGALAGLGFAYHKKSKFWGYVGYFILGNIVGSLVGNIIKPKK